MSKSAEEPRRVLITGASRGIGLAASERFARQGCELALLARGEEALHEAAAAVRREGGARAHVLPCDVTDGEALADAVERAASALGGIDVVVSAAASGAYGRVWDVPFEDFERT